MTRNKSFDTDAQMHLWTVHIRLLCAGQVQGSVSYFYACQL